MIVLTIGQSGFLLHFPPLSSCREGVTNGSHHRQASLQVDDIQSSRDGRCGKYLKWLFILSTDPSPLRPIVFFEPPPPPN